MRNGEPLPTTTVASHEPVANRSRSELRAHLHEALGLLLQAYQYAIELEQDVWDFAVELHVLRAARLSNSDLRWLVGKGYIEHAVEITGPNDPVRCFRRTALLTLTDATCVVLTRSGAVVAREACSCDHVISLAQPQVALCNVLPVEGLFSRPKWDGQRRQLRVDGEIVKEFKLPSPNQETILIAFEEEGWPPRIDDPLPPRPQLDSRRRLHDTIKALNRKQKNFLVRFMGDGSGEGIRWELIPQKSDEAPASASCDQSA